MSFRTDPILTRLVAIGVVAVTGAGVAALTLRWALRPVDPWQLVGRPDIGGPVATAEADPSAGRQDVARASSAQNATDRAVSTLEFTSVRLWVPPPDPRQVQSDTPAQPVQRRTPHPDIQLLAISVRQGQYAASFFDLRQNVVLTLLAGDTYAGWNVLDVRPMAVVFGIDDEMFTVDLSIPSAWSVGESKQGPSR